MRWISSLPGSWVAHDGADGTTPVKGQAYAAIGSQLAAVGSGLSVSAYRADTGKHVWTTDLIGFPPGSAIVSVRVWPGVVTVGVGLPVAAATPSAAGTSKAASSRHAASTPEPGAGAGAGPQAAHEKPGSQRRWAGITREEVVLRAATGYRMGAHPAAPFGGAVAAGPNATVIVAERAVVCYSNRTGAVLWTRATGPAAQAWQVDGDRLYVTVAAGGYLGAAPATALRLIDLRSGAERLVRPRGPAFAGALSLAFGGMVLFSGANGVTAYSGTTGALLWRRSGVLPDAVDAVRGSLYLIAGNVLHGVNPRTGAPRGRVAGAAAAASSGLYGVREGTVLGIDRGALGKAWGYQVAARRVGWTSPTLPWPHYFVDLSGIGGSAPPTVDAVLLAVCPRLGPPLPETTARSCEKPELVAVNR
ncbi:MAG TPA: PQQ-binding-like beta-propeller repeat protein [Streptosporangiaceae bacterium]